MFCRAYNRYIRIYKILNSESVRLHKIYSYAHWADFQIEQRFGRKTASYAATDTILKVNGLFYTDLFYIQ